MLRLNIENLECGMILSEDIYNHFDALIIPIGTILNEYYINILLNMGFSSVKILKKTVEKKELFRIEENILMQQEYKNTVESFKNLFLTMKLGNKIISTEVEEILLPLVDEVKNNRDIIKKLWQLESCDEYTYDHSVTVCLVSSLIAKWIGFSNEKINEIAVAGLLHDVGKCNIPDEILNKPDKLTNEEFKIMKTHSTLGYMLLKTNGGFSENILAGAYQHHEKYDGKGYPNNLEGNEINLFGRIIAVADIYSAMTSNRIYRKKSSPFHVAKLILDNSFGYLDPIITGVFLKNISSFYIGSIVKLSNNKIGEVIMENKHLPSRPVVKIDDEYLDLSKNMDIEIESLIE